MELLLLLAIAAVAFFVAFLFSNLGLGGGLLYMPLLILIGSLPFPEARPVSLAAAVATSAVSAFNHHRAGKLEPKKGAMASGATVAGVVVGLLAIPFVPDRVMEILFALFLLVVAMHLYRDIDDKERAVVHGVWVLPLATLLAFGSGLVSIALAVGGGLLLVPLFVYVLGVEPRKAVGTASMVAAVNTLAGLLLLFAFPTPGTVFDGVAMGLMAGVAAAGAFLGSRWGLKELKTRSVYLVLVVVMVAASGLMMLQGLNII